MKSIESFAVVVAAAILSSPRAVESFAPTSSRRVGAAVAPETHRRCGRAPSSDGRSPRLLAPAVPLAADDADVEGTGDGRRSRLLASVRRRSRPVAVALLTATALLPGHTPVPHAGASAPIVLRAAKKKEDPPMVQAMKQAEKMQKARSLEEFDAFMARCNGIEEAEGKKARDAYEKQYQLDKAAAEGKKALDVENLKMSLLDKGRDPHTDLDAEREVFLLEHGVDLEKISGTPQNENMIRNFQSRGRKKMGKKGGAAAAEELEKQRYIVACQVADLKARGVDPMDHFAKEEVREKTRAIYKMDDRVAARVAEQYRALMDEHGGRLTPPSEGEVPFVYSAEGAGDSLAVAAASEAATKPGRGAQRRNERAMARADRREQRAADKATVREKRKVAKEKKLAEKAAALASKEAAIAGEMAAAVGSAAVDSSVAATTNGDVSASAGSEAMTESSAESTAIAQPATAAPSTVNEILSQVKVHATPRNAATLLIAGGAAVYGINYYKENNGAAQSERERQLKLILGEDEDDDEDDDDFDDDEDDEYEQFTKKSPEPPVPSKPKSSDSPKAVMPKPPPLPVEPPKPKRLGIFSKRNANLRETDLNVLVQPTAQAPDFAALLAKVLTFGAPGRFPTITAWGAMPFETFDLEGAKALITETRDNADLSEEQAAEVFASVVNCMIIDIVDLASSTLKVKNQEEKVTTDAINVVMDFMDHAASLFDAVAQDVTIKPVTYGGKLRKKELEQMFSVYAGSSMMSLDALAGEGGGTTQDRVDTLQLVFAITDKKAEGLMQKHMMKMMMNLMKDGGKGVEGMPGMEGMEDMMKMMGGAEGGMPGMPGMDGGEVSPEELKQTLGMMEELMDSGQVSEEELKEIRSQFKEMYGSDISDLIKQASDEGAEEGMTEDERELMNLFKRILGEE